MTALLLTIPLVAAAPVPKDFQKPAPKLDGAWKLTGMELNGQPLETSLDQIWRFDSDRLVIGTGTGYTSPKQAILTDPDASPSRFQFDNDFDHLGVYEIAGDTLVICLGQQRGVRPPNTGGGQSVIRYRFTRAAGK